MFRISRMKNTEFEVTTTRNGYRLASSIDGSLTGRGGDLLIVDDPLKPLAKPLAGRERLRRFRIPGAKRYTAHSSFCSSSTAPTRRVMAASLGKIPTTSSAPLDLAPDWVRFAMTMERRTRVMAVIQPSHEQQSLEVPIDHAVQSFRNRKFTQ
jgi:hypothetical protein